MKASNCELQRTVKVRKAMRESASAMIDDLQRVVDQYYDLDKAILRQDLVDRGVIDPDKFIVSDLEY